MTADRSRIERRLFWKQNKRSVRLNHRKFYHRDGDWQKSKQVREKHEQNVNVGQYNKEHDETGLKKETQHGTCKPLDWSLLVLPAYDKRIGATIRLDTRQKWDYEIIPSGMYRLHRENVTIMLSREWFADGWEIIQGDEDEDEREG